MCIYIYGFTAVVRRASTHLLEQVASQGHWHIYTDTDIDI